jgi:hypothetical protein
VVAVAAGAYHNLALTSEGRVRAWGRNDSRQTEVPEGLTRVIAIAAGDYHSLALVRYPLPTLELVLEIPGNTPRLRISGPAGYVYDLQTSSDLMVWSSLTLLTNKTGAVFFSDSAPQESPRFYRAVER